VAKRATCFREVTSLNMSRDTDYSDAFRGFTQHLYKNPWSVP